MGSPIMMPDSTQFYGAWPGFMIIALIVFVITGFIYRYTVLGEYVRAIGGDETVARLSGTPIRLYKTLILVISGALAGLGGIHDGGAPGRGEPVGWGGVRTRRDASVVLGGTPLTGGTGRVYGTILGAVIMSAIGNGLVMLGVPDLSGSWSSRAASSSSRCSFRSSGRRSATSSSTPEDNQNTPHGSISAERVHVE